MRQLRAYAVIGLLLLGATSRATSFAPYPEQCIVDSSGRYYVVVKRNDKGDQTFPYGSVTLTIAQRRDGSPPVRSASATRADGDSVLATVDSKIRVRDGDIVRGRIDLGKPPQRVLISATRDAIVTVDEYGFNNLGPRAGDNDLVIYSFNGKVLHRKKRSTLFDEEAQSRFPRIDGALGWLGAAWLDPKRDQVVLVGQSSPERPQSRPILTVSLTSGRVRPGGPDLIDRAIVERNPDALSVALDLAREMKLSGSKGSLAGIEEAGDIPLGERLRAAVLLATLGDRRGAGLVTKTVLMGTAAEADSPRFAHFEEVYYAIEHSTEVLGDDALPLLRKTLRSAGSYGFAHYKAFGSLGRKAVPTLLSVLEDDRNVGSQLEAATCLGFMGSDAEEAIPALIRALHKKTTKKLSWTTLRLDSHAAWALEHIGEKAKAAIPHLEQLARDPDEDVKNSVLRALAAIRGQSPRP